jgi:hypothetical protein
MVRVALILVAIAAGACATTRTTVTPIEIAQEAAPILRDGSAEVIGLKGKVRVSASDMVDIHVREGDLERPMRVSVRALVEKCIGGVQTPGCLAGQAVDEPALERHRVAVDRPFVTSAIGIGLLGGTLGFCLATCRDDVDVGKGLAVGGGIVLGVAALFVLLAVAGH